MFTVLIIPMMFSGQTLKALTEAPSPQGGHAASGIALRPVCSPCLWILGSMLSPRVVSELDSLSG